MALDVAYHQPQGTQCKRVQRRNFQSRRWRRREGSQLLGNRAALTFGCSLPAWPCESCVERARFRSMTARRCSKLQRFTPLRVDRLSFPLGTARGLFGCDCFPPLLFLFSSHQVGSKAVRSRRQSGSRASSRRAWCTLACSTRGSASRRRPRAWQQR